MTTNIDEPIAIPLAHYMAVPSSDRCTWLVCEYRALDRPVCTTATMDEAFFVSDALNKRAREEWTRAREAAEAAEWKSYVAAIRADIDAMMRKALGGDYSEHQGV